MLIISWNVAGLSTTLQRIHRDYNHPTNTNSKANKNKNKSTSLAFSQFLHRHGNPDILCIQEHKIPLSQLSSRSEPFQVSTTKIIPSSSTTITEAAVEATEYESFWSCCIDASKKGFNGVVTFVKKGMTINATSTPFQDYYNDNNNNSKDKEGISMASLDNQGRCIMTDHGSFVIFNVYVPAGGSNPLSYKMKFLKTLQSCMNYQRNVRNKRVILVGDLNICQSGLDEHRRYRDVHVNHILNEVNLWRDSKRMNNSTNTTDNGDKNEIPYWKIDIAKHWNTIQSSLSTIEAIPTTTKNLATGSTFEKYRARITITNEATNTNDNLDNRKVFLGKAESTKEECIGTFTFPQRTYYDDDLQKDIISREENVIPLNILYEIMTKVVGSGINWGSSTLASIADTDGLKKSSPQTDWLNGLLSGDESNNAMIDAFRYLHPNAKGRFTCWEQRTNSRFENLGIRIDYTIIDELMTKYIDITNKPILRCCNYPKKDNDFYSEEAALHAATASGQYQGASFEGGGIAEASQSALDSQFGDGIPHTGIIYTPPSYSDHVAISLLLNEDWDRDFVNRTLVLDSKCSKTKKAQPHKSQKSISSFFGQGSNGNSSSSGGDKTNAKFQSKVSNNITKQQGSLQKTLSSVSSSSSTSVKRKATNQGNVSSQKAKGTLHSFFKK